MSVERAAIFGLVAEVFVEAPEIDTFRGRHDQDKFLQDLIKRRAPSVRIQSIRRAETRRSRDVCADLVDEGNDVELRPTPHAQPVRTRSPRCSDRELHSARADVEPE